MFNDSLKKRQARQTLEKYISPEKIESILEGNQTPPMSRGRIEFVLTYVRDENPEAADKHVTEVISLEHAHNGMVHNIIGALVVVAFGTHPADTSKPASRHQLVDALQSRLGKDAKILHGVAPGHYGIMGGTNFSSYTFIISHFDSALGTINKLDFGEVKEIFLDSPSKQAL